MELFTIYCFLLVREIKVIFEWESEEYIRCRIWSMWNFDYPLLRQVSIVQYEIQESMNFKGSDKYEDLVEY